MSSGQRTGRPKLSALVGKRVEKVEVRDGAVYITAAGPGGRVVVHVGGFILPDPEPRLPPVEIEDGFGV